jgi:excinuclease ABC subunit A
MEEFIKIIGAKEHNLKNISVNLPKNKLVVITGLSGSGKSSLAFDTVYAEGQRRYVESLSAYARQFLHLQNKPNVESITGLSPAIAIDQKTTSRNPRSTVGTITEIYDYLRLLFARIGIPYSPATGKPIKSQSVVNMVDTIMELPKGSKFYILAPIVRGTKGEHRKELLTLRKQGYQRIKVDNEIHELDDLPTIDKNKKHDIDVLVDRLVLEEDMGNRLVSSLETALILGDGLAKMEIVSIPEDKKDSAFAAGEIITFSEKFACPESGFQIDEIEPRIFSFNSPYGACEVCEGIGVEKYFDLKLVISDDKLSIKEGAIKPWAKIQSKHLDQTLESLSKHFKFSLHHDFKDLPKDIQDILLWGSGEEKIEITFTDGLAKKVITKTFDGVMNYLENKLHNSVVDWERDELKPYMSKRRCGTCGGYRLKPETLCIRVGDQNIGQVADLTIEDARDWFTSLPKKLTATQNKIAERVLKEIRDRLGFLINVGLEYLTLSRESGTLSGGESQRIRLASQIGSGLCGVLYVLDEPSIGLHQRDNSKLITTLKHLRDLGNTVIVVEHDHDTMMSADYLLDIGPGAGAHGGEIIAQGTPEEVMRNPNSITGHYLTGKKSIPIPKKLREGLKGKKIILRGAKANNLKNVTAEFPLGKFICITGVSGGGKSSLIIHTLYKAAIKKIEGKMAAPGEYESIEGLEYLDKVIEIDQSPIGRTPRSNPATYTGAFNFIRDWFVGLPESKARGYKPGRFSFNVKGGRCEACQGDGVIKIEMHFLPDVYVQCEECKGARYNRPTLEVKYKNKSIADVLGMTVDEALEFFDTIPSIKSKFDALSKVGLGYIKIGQSATTLSGGEAQRIKLAKELARRSTGRTLYILDEPTTGLHTDDIKKLLRVLHSLVDLGNTVIVIEHNLDVIKTSDYTIDIGPEGGDKGGMIVATGTPEEIIKNTKSVTGKYLKAVYKTV